VHGDFSNVTFRPEKQFSQVFDLQGRVGLDSGANEQRAILQHYLRAAVADLVGPAAGPATVDGLPNAGFRIEQAGSDLKIGAGRYYVDGVAVSNVDADARYLTQPPYDRLTTHPYRPGPLPSAAKNPFLVYLRVWERHVTEVEDPALHEFALGIHHPDSTSRSQITWRVELAEFKQVKPGGDRKQILRKAVDDWLATARATAGRGVLKVRATRPDDADDNPCAAGPDAAYLGENQLYRVEIRQGGTAADGATFVWSRDNGSVIYPIATCSDTEVVLTTLGRDWHTTLEAGAWVEVVDDAVSLRPGLGKPAAAPALRRVTDVRPETMTVLLDDAPPDGVGTDPLLHPYLRRWDMPSDENVTTELGVPIRETTGDPAGLWIPLERGIEAQFLPAADPAPAMSYRSGDFWTFPARRVLADVVFDYSDGRPPMGLDQHYAPLAVVDGDGTIFRLRQLFGPTLTPEG
jgi:Family of unknown function (DUF6519)